MRARTLLTLVLVTIAGAQSPVLDKVVAVVNRHVVTQSDWQEQEAFEALMDGRPPANVQFNAASLQRIIDQQLIADQIAASKYFEISGVDIAAQVAAIRAQIAPGKDDAAWQKLLAGYGLTSEDFAGGIQRQLNVMRFVEMRFRPTILITPDKVQAYYREVLVPELKANGTRDDQLPSFATVQEKITAILTEKRVDEMLTAWLEALRSQSQIQVLVDLPKPGGASQAATK
jgi:hypothetical protein